MNTGLLRPIYLMAILLTAWILPSKAQYNPQQYFTYLESTFNEHERSLHNYLIDELSYFLQLFPDGINSGRVQYMLASVYKAKGDEHEALAAYLKMLFIYPTSAVIKANTDDLRELITNERAFRDQEVWLLGFIDQNYGNLSAAEAYLKYLEVLVQLKDGKLRDWNLAVSRDFMKRFPDNPHHDKVLRWMAEIYMASKEYEEANTALVKFAAIFPKSPYLVRSLYQRGQLYYENLNKPEKAVEVFSTIVSDYPDSSLAGDALFALGEIKEKKEKDYPGAIANYNLVIDNYPANKKGLDALWNIAGIQTDRNKEYPAAIATYERLLEKYPGNPKGIEALEKMAGLFESKIEDYDSAAKSLARIADMYPGYEKAADRLIEAGELSEKRLKDYEQSIAYYQKVLDDYGSSDRAKVASKKIEDARKQLSQK